jgi:hypothetical protein
VNDVITVKVKSTGVDNVYVTGTLGTDTDSCYLFNRECDLSFNPKSSGTHVGTAKLTNNPEVSTSFSIMVRRFLIVDMVTEKESQNNAVPIVVWALVKDDSGVPLSSYQVNSITATVKLPSGATKQIATIEEKDANVYPGNFKISYSSSEIGNHLFKTTATKSEYLEDSGEITIYVGQGSLDISMEEPADKRVTLGTTKTIRFLITDVNAQPTNIDRLKITVIKPNTLEYGVFEYPNRVTNVGVGKYTVTVSFEDKGENHGGWDFIVEANKGTISGSSRFTISASKPTTPGPTAGGVDIVYVAVVAGAAIAGIYMFKRR